MASKLSNELREEIAANPHQAVPVIDEESGKVYYVVDDEFLFGKVEQNAESFEQLKKRVEEGFASGEVSEEDARTRMRKSIDQYRDHTT